MIPLIPLAMQLAQFAPGIIRLLTGSDKAEEVAGKVIDVAKVITGTDDGPAAVAAIQADPQKMLDFQLAYSAQKIEWERIYLADVQNSRSMQISALTQEDKFSKRFVYYFAMAWSLFAMVYFTAVTFIEINTEGGQRVADTILGVLISSVVGGIFAFFYGSNKGSEAKSALLALAAPPETPH
jgi:hypothetical protein